MIPSFEEQQGEPGIQSAGSPLRSLRIEDFNYPLPQERIALYPLAERDQSKLLVYRPWLPEEERIAESVFRNVADFLPKPSLLVFNDTRVVRARLVFYKRPATTVKTETGNIRTGQTENTAPAARIEIFCLEPVEPADIAQAFAVTGYCRFKCLIGNNKRWKEGPMAMEFPLPGNREGGRLQARRIRNMEEAFLVEFSWEPAGLSFAEVLELAGKVPLPPYIHRQAEESDNLRYQTVFARYDGSVAAPTAGLHFTPQILESLSPKGIERDFITLHVGAGTFKPVKAEEIGEHRMHQEHICISRPFVTHLAEALEKGKPVIPVGTTSMRSLESLYWIGVQLAENPEPEKMEFEVGQWDPYERYAGKRIPPREALLSVTRYMDRHGSAVLHGYTSLMIAPGYEFAFCQGLITNFHQPQSTLLLLVSALIGQEWKKIYGYALKNGFRFLSYGDSCLFLKFAK